MPKSSSKLPEITIRAMEPDDVETLYEVENDITLWDVGATNVPYSRQTLSEFIATSTNDIYVDRQVRLMVCDKTGEVAGIIDLFNFEPRHQRVEVGIVIKRPMRGKGYGLAALLKVIDYARHILHLHQLYAIINTCNTPCLNTFLEAGFTRAATLLQWLRDDEQYRDAAVLQLLLQ